jgi:outer membrane protein OmpA-like peptidoglycan-associated protein
MIGIVLRLIVYKIVKYISFYLYLPSQKRNMKKILHISVLALLSVGANAQDFLGLSTGNYAGISGVHLQPASIADNRYKFDFNIASFSLGFKSNFIGFDRTFAVNNRFNFGKVSNFYDFRQKSLTQLPLAAGVKGYTNVTNTFQIPVSFMLATGKNSAIALNMRSRTALAINNIPSQMADILFEINDSTKPFTPKNMNANGFAMNGVSWLDIGLTYARVLVNSGQHFVKAGVTGKYIGGVSSFNLEADQLNITATDPNNVAITSGTSYVKYSHSPTNFNVRPENYRPDASSFGFDAGIVYEFRGRIANFKVGKYGSDGEVVSKLRRDKNKYTFRLGASLVDAGKMNFTSAAVARDFQINSNVNFPKFVDSLSNGVNLDKELGSKAGVVYRPGTGATDYSIALPTSLNVQLDLHLIKGLYVNGMINRSFKELNSGTTYRAYTPEYIVVTPRWESRYLGLYVPIMQNNQEKDWRIGTTVRIAGFFAGTNNLATLFKSKSINEADVHAGIKLPLGFGRPSKAFQKLNKLKKQVTNDTTTTIIDVKSEENFKNNDDMEARLRELEAKLKAAELEIAELEKNKNVVVPAVNTPIAETPAKVVPVVETPAKVVPVVETPAKAIPAAPATPKAVENQPVRIIINNYNAPGAPTQSIDIDGGVDSDINELKRRIELKEKMLEELKKTDKSTGCVDNKKKIASLKANFQNSQLENAIAPVGNSVFASTAEMMKTLSDMKTNNSAINVDIDKEIKTVNDKLATTNIANEEYNCLLWKKNELLDLKLDGRSARMPKIPVVISKTEEITVAKPQTPIVSNGSNADYARLLKEIEALRKEKATVIRVRDTVIIERVIEKPMVQYVDKIVDRPVDRVVEKIVDRPVDRVVEKIVDRPVDRVVEKIVDRPVDRVVEKIIDRPVAVEKTITKIEQLLSLPPDVVLFDVGKSVVKPQYFTRLTYYATQIKKFPELQVMLNGYTDNSGNAALNQRLSEARAKAVKTYLMSKGVQENQIEFNFAGADNPIADNGSKIAKSQNRRVEISFNK